MNKTKTIRSIFILIIIFTTLSCTFLISCNNNKNTTPPILTKTLQGGPISLYDTRTTEYLSLKDDNQTANFLKKYKGEVFDFHVSHNLLWTGGTAPYTIIFSLDSNMNSIYLQRSSNNKKYAITTNDYLTQNTYYYQIVDSKGSKSEIDSFTTDTTMVPLNLMNVYNVRDLGGLKTSNNKTIKYKKLIRGGVLDNAFASDIKIFNELGIKTDLDLRGATTDDQNLSETGPSPIGLQNYYLTKIKIYNDLITYYTEQSSLFKKTFDVLCDETNYPIYFHCTWGADRTGTIALLIEGLLGVDIEDIYKDYEFTSFSKTGARWRSNIIGEDGNYSFDNSGVMRSDVRFGLTITKLLSNYSNGTNDLQLAVKNYLLSIGITQTQLDNLVKILTE